MGVFRGHRIAIRVPPLQLEGVVFVALADGRTGSLVAADGFLLEGGFHVIPMVEGNPDRPNRHIAAGAQPRRPLLTDPDEPVHRRPIVGRNIHRSVLETHQVPTCLVGQRPLLVEAIALTESLQDYVSRDLLSELLAHNEATID